MLKNKIVLAALLILFFVSFGQILSAQGSSHSLILQTSTIPEAKLQYAFNYKLPFMQGDSPLTAGNNLSFTVTPGISPASFDVVGSVVWTPIAFIEITAGGRFYTGWNLDLFGDRVNGLATTQADYRNPPSNTLYITEEGGVVGKGFFGGAFQFDLAAIIPGDWNHVIFRTYHEINYAGYSKAAGNSSWKIEGDDGENANGFKYFANAVLGYQMPIFLNMAAFMAEMDLNLYNIEDKKDWGGNLPQWTFSGILNFQIHKQFGVTVITQFRTRKNYTEDKKYWDGEKAPGKVIDDYYYRTLTIDSDNPLRVEFYRVAAIATFRF